MLKRSPREESLVFLRREIMKLTNVLASPDLIKPPVTLPALAELAASVCYSASNALTHIPANFPVVALLSN